MGNYFSNDNKTNNYIPRTNNTNDNTDNDTNNNTIDDNIHVVTRDDTDNNTNNDIHHIYTQGFPNGMSYVTRHEPLRIPPTRIIQDDTDNKTYNDIYDATNDATNDDDDNINDNVLFINSNGVYNAPTYLTGKNAPRAIPCVMNHEPHMTPPRQIIQDYPYMSHMGDIIQDDMDIDYIRDNIRHNNNTPRNNINKQKNKDKKEYFSIPTQKFISLKPQHIIHQQINESKNYFYNLNDFLISLIILLIPKDIRSLYNTSKRIRFTIQNHTICNALYKYGLNPELYECAVNSNDFDFVQYVYNNRCYYHDFPDNQIWYSHQIDDVSHQFPLGQLTREFQRDCIANTKSKDLCFIAYKNNNKKMFEFLYAHKFPLSINFGEHVSLTGDYEMLQLYIKQSHGNDNITQTMFSNSIINGNYKCLKLLMKHSCDHAVTYNLCMLAISNGHLKCLKYLVKQGFHNFEETMCLEAIRKKHWNCVKYLLKHNCPFNFNTIVSLCKNNKEMMDYLRENEAILKKKSFVYRHEYIVVK